MVAYPRFFLEQYPEIEELLRDWQLTFPIPTRENFIHQMCASGRPVVFRRISYDPKFAAGLMPAFFFPVASPEDMLQKGVELMIARGLFKFPESGDEAGPGVSALS